MILQQVRKMINKIISRTITGFAALIIVFILVLNFFGYKTYAVASSSMKPTIPQYRLVFVSEVRNPSIDDFALDDVVVIKGESIPMLHRIVKIENEVITTKGDANNINDQDITINHISGIYEFSIPILGIFVIHYRLVFIGILIAATIVVVKAIKETKKEEVAHEE